jgi:hypothetical protein
MRIQIQPEAENDLVLGCEFYEDISDGLGFYFLRCLYEDIDQLKSLAGIHTREYGFQRIKSHQVASSRIVFRLRSFTKFMVTSLSSSQSSIGEGILPGSKAACTIAKYSPPPPTDHKSQSSTDNLPDPSKNNRVRRSLPSSAAAR